MKHTLYCVLILLCSASLQAQEFRFSAQLRERTEINMKSLTPGDRADVYHLLRSRLRADAFAGDDVQVAFELQDSRMFGIEESTLNKGLQSSGFTTAFDVRSAWLRVHDIAGSAITGTLGRMPLDYGNSRFIGSREPYNVTQSFNGIVLSRAFNNVRLDAFALALRDRDFAPPGLSPLTYLVDGSCAGLWAEFSASKALTASAFYIYDNPILFETALNDFPIRDAFADVRQLRHTTGLRAVADADVLKIDAEGAYQFGSLPGDNVIGRPDRTIAAYFYALSLSARVPGTDIFTLTAGYENRSGDVRVNGVTGDTFELFSTIHGNVYQYHGFINYFQGQYAHSTALHNNGLRELYLRLDANISADATVFARVHSFSEAVDPVTSAGPGINYSSAIGKEGDIWCVVKFTKGATAGAGFTIFNVDHKRAEALGVKKTTNWSYLVWTFTI